jgi:glyoxylase-like metal-dependent hydrolase (beta-lactamase superfamily II)
MRKVSAHTELYLVTTHFHPEHDLGAAAFPATARMIRARAQQQDIDEFDLELARTFSKRSPTIAGLLEGATYRKADVVFDGEHALDLGGVHVRLMSVGPTHTRGDTVAFVQEDRVLFAGDVAMPALPAVASPHSSVKAWLAALSRLSSLDAARIVPSHGEMGDGRLIAGYRSYFETLQRRAAELRRQGVALDAAVEMIAKELQPAYEKRQPGRIPAAARVAYQEAVP